MIGSKFNLGSLMKNAKKMQEMMEKAKAELAKVEVIGEAGAGVVKVTMNARHQVIKITIDPELQKEDIAVLEELIAAAFNDASNKVDEVTKSKMMNFSDMLGGMKEEEEKEKE